ncbi:MAG: FAD-dependent oxidoreductase [Spartobacteria bacterium]
MSTSSSPEFWLSNIQEPSRTTPVVNHSDVLVCGGGPAGVAAAIAAAREGARTTLLELHGCLGGVWTAGALTWIIDHKNKSGVMKEILDRLQAGGVRACLADGTWTNGYDHEGMKSVLEEMCMEAGIRIRLHTRVVAAGVDETNRLTHVITESKSGREAWSAGKFVDATGDGDLAAAAGCGFDMGRDEDGHTQPMSLLAILTGIEADEVRGFISDEGLPWGVPLEALRKEMNRAGVEPSYAKPTLFRIHDNLFTLMANHQYLVKGTNAEDLSRTTLEARAEVRRIVDGLRKLGGCWANLRLVSTGAQIGVREGRRIHGRYTVSADDLRNGAQHEDAVADVTFCVDIHSVDPKKDKGLHNGGIKTKPYQIPLRALIARDVDGLLLAGRCISGDFFAHASYRVTGNAVATGEAAGRHAARTALGIP